MVRAARLLGALGAALALLLVQPCAPAHAQARVVEGAVGEGIEFRAAHEIADAAVVQAALGEGGFDAIGRQLGALNAVMAHAPPRYPQIELRGDIVLVRAYDNAEGELLARRAGRLHPPANGELKVKALFNVYGAAALMLGSYAVEKGRPAEALAILDRALVMQPTNPGLASEKGAALVSLRRFGDALAAYDAGLAAQTDPQDPFDQARLLRGRGYALVELGRLDDAEAAFKTSLDLEPGHGAALNELAYIAQLRAGAPPTPTTMMTGDKAKTLGQ